MTSKDPDFLKLRAQDFVTAIALVLVSVFFLWRTSLIPFFDAQAAGVNSAEWYNSAALVPYGIFVALLAMAFGLLWRSIKDGGAAYVLSGIGIRPSRDEATRFTSIAVILLAYIFGLVPRVDFIICSAVLIAALIWGFHDGLATRQIGSAVLVGVAGLYALIAHFPQSEWQKPHDDDWVALLVWVVLTGWMLYSGGRSRVMQITPILSILAPLLLVVSMAFGFRQNVPNRSGLIFSKIEFHYYVTLRPLWQGQS